ncbi:SMI1/KNR4 family protein [Chitinophaga silvisoli]|uniref:Knr4/Smi1-like domain-containing protein n=1 Tax=Chitinophaga silvisoli TaxID=2291814 RepID=A0A3E1P7P5_9BACT|nr:SMI1/KNR4 family protein [Chitinophaga silvisoli]RFM36229.1 hypothetical protein DXN04_01600 [Chitinophaga silvisoli]
MQPNSIKAFKRLYVTARKAMNELETLFSAGQFNERLMEQVIAGCDQMIPMLPMEFPTQEPLATNSRILLVNLADPEDEPQQIEENENGNVSYNIPENTDLLYESTIQTVLENWKFMAWNIAVHAPNDPQMKSKYLPFLLAQAAHCMQRFPHDRQLMRWEQEMYVLYANQIGWFTYEREQDPEKLETALAVVEKGYQHANWKKLSYIKDTKVRLLLKLNRPQEAYPIIREALAWDEDYPDFQDLKKDEGFLTWQAVKDEEAQKAQAAFMGMIKSEQEKVVNKFINPGHPLVIQHADVLNLIKQRMVSCLFHKMYQKDRIKVKENFKEERFALQPWSPEAVLQFEKDNDIRLPDELKVYLMEIGEGGKGYFCYGGIDLKWLIDKKEDLENARKPFPVTEDKVHDICHWWELNAWVEPDDEEWKEVGILDKDDDMKEMFGLPAGAKMNDGCFEFGYAASQDPLLLIMNGVFEGEVWVDTLQYGAEAGGCFAPASAKKLKFLEFIAASVLANELDYTNGAGKGSWM